MRTVSLTSRRRHPARDHAYLHVDAVQGMHCDLRDIDADLLTVSAHKIPPILHPSF
jgi:cysteine sulfinate desulfinase/cysteine desulfurase-like protein